MAATADNTPTPWHSLPADEALTHLEVDAAAGLTQEQITSRAHKHGPNRLAEARPRSLWKIYLSQFKNALILMLFIAALVAGSVGNIKDALVILTVVMINSVLGFYQEYRAERSLLALKNMLPHQARVRREAGVIELRAEELLPGDIVLLEAGERIPADGRVIMAATLQIDESGLTGESQPVTKEDALTLTAETPLAERATMLYMNTMVTRGRGEMVVTATGMQSEMGKLSAELANAEQPPSPLQIQLDRVGKRLGIVTVVLVLILFTLAILRGDPLVQVLMESISLAVAAIPEGLPAVVTVTLALGMRRMARKRAIIKRLASVETLGCATVICSDKTGTLTLNQMTVRALLFGAHSYSVTGEGYNATGEIIAPTDASQPDLTPLLRASVLCNDSRLRDGTLIGDPTEGALLALALKGSVERSAIERQLPRIAEIPFDSAHKFMATFHHDGPHVQIFIKGAPDLLLSHCSQCLRDNSAVPFDDELQQLTHSSYQEYASQGLRGLVVAMRTLTAEEFNPASDLHSYIEGLILLGLVGIMDPPRPEAKAAIDACGEAGIMVKMITGDHADTAAAIARELGLKGNVISGTELERLSEQQLTEQIEGIAVFARVIPEQKVKIVRALQARGHVVAMTGDGVNDAPALKSADIGVAMGMNGTEVAKEAATMILTDDNFATIVAAVHEGRTLYDNILKFIRFQLSTTMGALMTVFFAPLVGLPSPFTAVQILWVAIIMDGPPAVALALDRPHPEIMQRPPRGPNETMLTARRIAQTIGFGAIMTIGTLTVLHYALQHGSKEEALTLAFTTFVLFQVFNVFNARAECGTAFRSGFFNNSMLWLSLTGVVTLQVIAVHWPPAQLIFNTVALDASDWLTACAVAASIVMLEELRKLVMQR